MRKFNKKLNEKKNKQKQEDEFVSNKTINTNENNEVKKDKNSQLQTYFNTTTDDLNNKDVEDSSEPTLSVDLEPYENSTFSLPLSIVDALEDWRNKLRKEHRKDGPDKTHFVVLALKRMFNELEGEHSNLICQELLEMKRQTRSRKKRKAKRQ